MHFCLLIGYGASAVNPYLAIETLEDLANRGSLLDGITFEKALNNYLKAKERAAQNDVEDGHIDPAKLLRRASIRDHWFGQESSKNILRELHPASAASDLTSWLRKRRWKHELRVAALSDADTDLDLGGNYQFRINGEQHVINPFTVTKLRQAVRQSDGKSSMSTPIHQ